MPESIQDLHAQDVGMHPLIANKGGIYDTSGCTGKYPLATPGQCTIKCNTAAGYKSKAGTLQDTLLTCRGYDYGTAYFFSAPTTS